MGKKLSDILKGAAVMGLFAGLYSLTGQDLDPQNVIVSLCDVLVNAMSGNLNSAMLQLWGDIKFALVVYGIITLIVFVLSVVYCGTRGILTATCGYFGMILLITGLKYGLNGIYLPTLLLVSGVLIATYIPDKGRVKIVEKRSTSGGRHRSSRRRS